MIEGLIAVGVTIFLFYLIYSGSGREVLKRLTTAVFFLGFTLLITAIIIPIGIYEILTGKTELGIGGWRPR